MQTQTEVLCRVSAGEQSRKESWDHDSSGVESLTWSREKIRMVGERLRVGSRRDVYRRSYKGNFIISRG